MRVALWGTARAPIHLTPSQRAMLALELEQKFAAEIKAAKTVKHQQNGNLAGKVASDYVGGAARQFILRAVEAAVRGVSPFQCIR